MSSLQRKIALILIKTNNISSLEISGKNLKDKVLIFYPGLGAYKENYIAFSESLASNYKSVYILDLPEQGAKGEWTIGNMVDNLKEFINKIDNENLSEIHLAGHSAGAVAIISFLCNMDRAIEDIFLNSNNKISMSSSLIEMGFGQLPLESKKVTKLFLYSPCDSFANVFPKFLVKQLMRLNEKRAMQVMNILINKPSRFLKTLTLNKKFNFKINTNKKPQYFRLVLKNHKAFFNYIYNYKCIFELNEILDNKLRKRINNALSSKQIVIQFGSFDWLLISKNRCKKEMLNNFKVCSNVEIIEHNKLGHFLGKPFSLDLNLNNQMLINKSVINTSLNYIA